MFRAQPALPYAADSCYLLTPQAHPFCGCRSAPAVHHHAWGRPQRGAARPGRRQYREYHQLAMGQGQAEAALGLLHTCAKSGAHLHSMKFLLPVHTDPVRCSAPWLAQWSVVLLASPVLSGGISLSSTNKKCLTEVSLALLTRHQLFCACRGMAVPKKPAPDGWLAASVGEGSARPGAPSRFPPVSDH